MQYGGLLAEHRAVRAAAGLFDVSHMGEILIEGPGALEGVQSLVTNDCAKLAQGQVLYTVACREDGGVLDDLLVYRLAEERFLLVINAANADKMVAWCRSKLGDQLDQRDASPEFSQLALQGPASLEILLNCAPFAGAAAVLAGLPFYRFFESELMGESVLISRTGYTGERGYEIYLPWDLATPVAEAIMASGAARGLEPAGLGARDTLRFEASYCLYGHELDEATDPYEAGLFWLVKLEKGDFIGRNALRVRKDDPQARRLVGFAVPGRKIPRQGCPLLSGGASVGVVSSGSFAPSLERALGMGLVRRAARKEALQVEIRGERIDVETVKLPFYTQPALRARGRKEST